MSEYKQFKFWHFAFHPSRTMPSFSFKHAAIVFYFCCQPAYYYHPFNSNILKRFLDKHGSAQFWKIQIFW